MKIKVIVQETLVYHHELVIEADGEVSESKLERILNRAERESDNLDDVQTYRWVRTNIEAEEIKILEANLMKKRVGYL